MIVEDINEHLAKRFDKDNHKLLVSNIESYKKAGDHIDEEMIINNNKYKVVGVAGRLSTTNRGIDGFDLILKLVQKMH